MSEILTKPEWIPWYVQRVKGSSAWKELKDFQFSWYVKLLTELADSATPGYLPNDVGVLWKLAGAQTESFFRSRGGIELLARHFNRTEDGLRIYNARMLEVLHEQGNKRARRKRRTLSSLLSVVQNLPDWIPEEEFGSWMEMREEINKPLTARALKIAVRKLEDLKNHGHDVKRVLEESIFNRWQGLFEPKVGTNGTNGASRSGATGRNQNGFAEEKCSTCGGSGWDLSSGKAVRCECFNKNRAARAASGAKA